jgi:hypothetical protein
MANIVIKSSDVTGETIQNGDAVEVTIKGHAAVDGAPKVADTTLKELEALKTVEGLLELEIKQNGQVIKTVYAVPADFAKFLPDEKVKALRGNKGRAPGYSPVRNGN